MVEAVGFGLTVTVMVLEVTDPHELVLVTDRLMAVGWVMFIEAVDVFPLLSVTVTRAVPAGKALAVAVVSPLFQAYE